MLNKIRIRTFPVVRQTRSFIDIYEEFLNTFELESMRDSLDYEPVRPPYFDYYIHNAIHVQLKEGRSVIFISNNEGADQ